MTRPKSALNRSKPDAPHDGFRCPACGQPLRVYSTHRPAPGIRRRYKWCDNPKCRAYRQSGAQTEERVRQ